MPPFNYEMRDVPERQLPDHTEALKVEQSATRSMRIVMDILKSNYVDTRSLWRKFFEGSDAPLQSPTVTYPIVWPDELAAMEAELNEAVDRFADNNKKTPLTASARHEQQLDNEGEMQVRAWLECGSDEFDTKITLYTQLERVDGVEITVRRAAQPRVESTYIYGLHYLDYPDFGQEHLSAEDRLALATALNETVALIEAATNEQPADELNLSDKVWDFFG